MLKDFLRSEENWQVQGKPLLKYKLDVQITDSHLNVNSSIQNKLRSDSSFTYLRQELFEPS